MTKELERELIDALYAALPFVEDAAEDEVYKAHRVHRVLSKIKAALKEAEKCQG